MQFPTTDGLIRAEIDRLHARNSGDWQSLMRQSEAAYEPIRYNLAQMLAVMIPPTVKELDLEWGRGTGKTTVAATFMREIAQDLPRGTFQWIVPTYQKFLTEIIPAFIHALEMQGIYKDLHYFIGRRPPARWKWPEPYKPPVKYDNFVTFWTGFGGYLISQDVPGAGRGLSNDVKFADEVAMLSRQKMEENSDPSMRGSNVDVFKDRRWFDFRFNSGSTPLTPDGAWFTDREDMAKMSPDRHRFSKANCLCNLHNLKPDYLQEARRTSTDRVIFEAEYLNIRPRFTRNGFYALLSEEKHSYVNFNYGHYANRVGVTPDCRGDGDLVAGQPLILGLDWGAAINSMTVSQHLSREFRTLKDFYALGSEGETQDDLAERFHNYYQYHNNRDLWLWYDQTGNAQTGNSKLTRAQQMQKELSARGWRVRRMSLGGRNPLHNDKYILWERILEEKDARMPRFRINRQNAQATYISMSRAKAKRQADGTIRKDKSSERVDNKQRQFATDLSDAGDQPIFGMFKHLLRNFGSGLPDSTVSSR